MAPRKKPTPKEKSTSGSAEKKSVSIRMALSTLNDFDAYVKQNRLKNRGDGIRLLLDTVGWTSTAASSAESEPIWSQDEVEKLRRALDACNPSTDDQWRTIASSIGGPHTWDQYKAYAKSKLRYRAKKKKATPPPPRPKRTLRSRQQNDKALKERLLEESATNADLFKDVPEILSKVIPPLIDPLDISCLNTPASGVSYASRFELDQSSGCPTPAASFANASVLKKDVGSEARKQANRCINRIEPMLSKAILTTKAAGSTPKGRVKRLSKRLRVSNGLQWAAIKNNSSSADEDEDTYYSENA